jgi:hypothetical protein
MLLPPEELEQALTPTTTATAAAATAANRRVREMDVDMQTFLTDMDALSPIPINSIDNISTMVRCIASWDALCDLRREAAA